MNINILFFHYFFTAAIFGAGVAAVFRAYWLRTDRRDQKNRRTRQLAACGKTAQESQGDERKFFSAVKQLFNSPIFFLFAGIFMLVLICHSELSHHKQWLANLADHGNNNASSLLLGLLAVVMTLVTAGVITIARHAIDDIRREKKGLQDNYDEVKKLELWHKIMMFRLELLYENQQELDKYNIMFETLSPKEDWKRLFRESLQAFYAKRDHENIQKYIEDLYKRYNPEEHGKLLSLEIDYLNFIKKYYQEYPEETDKHPDIVSRIDEILKR
ncbi:MAG TPA: hypothetical protein ENJ30_14195 [Desulfobulbaceae bacterium]|nr:hypothetical protein [Desulfobulbaceae bacterium]